jgi:hypothetical protein
MQIGCRVGCYSHRQLENKLEQFEQLELDYGSTVNLRSQLKHGQSDKVAALVNRIRAVNFLDARASLELSGDASEVHRDDAESSDNVASEINWDSLNTSPGAFDGMPPNSFHRTLSTPACQTVYLSILR